MNNYYINSNNKEYIFSGEIHYFRVHKDDWKDRIEKAKKAHLNTISSYIPWRWHMPTEDTVDFEGKTFPERDLKTFCQLIKDADMYFIPRVGPVSHGEINKDGLPDWLMEKYPEILLKNDAGVTNPYSAMVDFHSDKLHDEIKKWYKNVLPILLPFRQKDGGNIIAMQLCNEIGMLSWLTKTPNYNQHSTKMLRSYLKEKYGTIENINKKLGTEFKSIDEIEQPGKGYDHSIGAFYVEWEEYYHEYHARYYEKLNSYIQEYDFGVRVIANIPQVYDYDVRGRGNLGIKTTGLFSDYNKYTKDVVFGGAYQFRRLDYENFHDVTALTEVVRMITPEDKPMICAEMQTGIMFDRPILYPSDVKLNLNTSCVSGLNAINMYMFAGGYNFLDMGGFGNFHNWQSAVKDNGELDHHYEPIKEVGELFEGIGDLLVESENVPEINIGLYMPYYENIYIDAPEMKDFENYRDRSFFDGLLRLIRLAGFYYRFVNIHKAGQEELNLLNNLWVFSVDCMDEDTQKKIAGYINTKKPLFIYPRVPEYDLSRRSCTAIKDALDIKTVREVSGGVQHVMEPGDDYEYFGGGSIIEYEFNNDKAIKPVYITKTGKSTVYKNTDLNTIVCGLDLAHHYDYQIDMVKKFAGLLEIEPEIQNENKRVNVILKRHPKTDILHIANYTEIPGEVTLNTKSKPLPESLTFRVPPRNSYFLLTNFAVTDDLLIHYLTAEIIGREVNGKSVSLTIRPIEETSVLLLSGDCPVKVQGGELLSETTIGKGVRRIVLKTPGNKHQVILG